MCDKCEEAWENFKKETDPALEKYRKATNKCKEAKG